MGLPESAQLTTSVCPKTVKFQTSITYSVVQQHGYALMHANIMLPCY